MDEVTALGGNEIPKSHISKGTGIEAVSPSTGRIESRQLRHDKRQEISPVS